ncbi:guanine nucleotide-binding protein subunit alpha [Thelotrema lepadinum]|nr:guanine nucleotide-binding protein subunit alpha [Thelotrema lepadinum]
MFSSRHIPFLRWNRTGEENLRRRPSEQPLLADLGCSVSEKVSPPQPSEQAARFDQPTVKEKAPSADLEKPRVDIASAKKTQENSIIFFAKQKLFFPKISNVQILLARWRDFKRSRRIDKYLQEEGSRRQMRVLLLGMGPWACSSWLRLFANEESTYIDRDPSWSVHELPRVRGERRKIIHLFEIITSITFTIDIRDYACQLEWDATVTRMQEDICLWDSCANSRHYRNARIALCFVKTAEFDEMLATEPITKYFKDCSDDVSQPEDAREYIAQQFTALTKYHNAADVNVFFIADLPKKEDWLAVKHFFLNGNVSS